MSDTCPGVSVDTVAPSQVIAAREYLRRVGNPILASHRTVAVANLPLDEVQEAWARRPVDDEKIHAAQVLIRMRGGEQNVEPRIVAIAHSRPSVVVDR